MQNDVLGGLPLSLLNSSNAYRKAERAGVDESIYAVSMGPYFTKPFPAILYLLLRGSNY